MKVRLVVDNLRPFYLHEIAVVGVRAKDSKLPVLHNVAYYTLNAIPEGEKLPASEWSTKKSAPVKAVVPAKSKTTATKQLHMQ